MRVSLLAARFFLATIFTIASLTKLIDRTGLRRTLEAFGIPTPLASPLGILLPLVELVIASTLLPSISARWGAAGALALLIVFMGGIVFNLAHGRTPECRCFGRLSAAPIGKATLSRNIALAAISGFIIWGGPGVNVTDWSDSLANDQLLGLSVGLLMLALLAAQGWFLFHLFQQNGRILLKLDALEAQLAGSVRGTRPRGHSAGLTVGTPAPDFKLNDLQGKMVTLESLRAAGKPLILIFSDPRCSSCTSLLPEIGTWQFDHGDKLTIAIISTGMAEASQSKAAEHSPALILLQNQGEVSDRYQVVTVPRLSRYSPRWHCWQPTCRRSPRGPSTCLTHTS